MIDIQITYMQIIETLSRSLYSNTDNNNIPYAYSSGYSTRVASISGTIYTTASINNPVYAQSVSQQAILNDIKSYVSRLGIDINAKPTARGLVAFLMLWLHLFLALSHFTLVSLQAGLYESILALVVLLLF